MQPGPRGAAGTDLARRAFILIMFAAGCVGYADRQVLGLLKPALDSEFGWSAADYANMATAFQLAIALALPWTGWFIDRAGLRLGFALGLGGWSIAAILHALCRQVWHFIAARAALGACESVATPAAMKTIALTYPPEARGMIIGMVNFAGSIAAILTPLLVPTLFAAVGWRGTVITLGLVGLGLCGAWLVLPPAPLDPRGETAPPAPPGGPPPFRPAGPVGIWRDAAVIGLCLAKLLSDQAWWFFLYWIPVFFHQRHGLDIKAAAMPIALVYGLAALGALAGGVLPLALGRARFTSPQNAALLFFALAAGPVCTASYWQSVWVAAGVIGVALFAHQGFSTGLFARATCAFPPGRVASIVGLAAFFGNLGGALSQQAAALCEAQFNSLAPMFAACAVAYPLAWLILRQTLPEPVPRGIMGS